MKDLPAPGFPEGDGMSPLNHPFALHKGRSSHLSALLPPPGLPCTLGNLIGILSKCLSCNQAALKQLPRNKVPNMAVMIKSLTRSTMDASVVFKDPTGEELGLGSV